MKFDTHAFKNASKRYADRHSLPLNEAQQAFSEMMGFKTTHDALIRLDGDDTVVNTPVPANAFWCDMTLPEFKLLFEVLFLGTGDRTAVHSDQARLLSRAVLGVIESEGAAPMRAMLGVSPTECSATVRTIEILSCMDMDAMDSTYLRLCDRHKTDRMIDWPTLERPMARYIQSLPEYDTRRIGKKGGQAPETRSHHLYIVAQLSRVFDLLQAIEDAGGAAACVRGADSIHEDIETLIQERRPANGPIGESIIKTAKMVELYPEIIRFP